MTIPNLAAIFIVAIVLGIIALPKCATVRDIITATFSLICRRIAIRFVAVIVVFLGNISIMPMAHAFEVTDYKVLCSSNEALRKDREEQILNEFYNEVKNHLKEGWRLQGGAIVYKQVIGAPAVSRFCQTLIK